MAEHREGSVDILFAASSGSRADNARNRRVSDGRPRLATSAPASNALADLAQSRRVLVYPQGLRACDIRASLISTANQGLHSRHFMGHRWNLRGLI